ncbi:MAG: N-acetyltransferase family protein [Gordonia sp. (in: high G+C Gram-positive bacteria)]|uniref:GNAT family N-acetyltransferase n=1 Tax=Gordonia sp. (in: high G+C Gram-positive bacteria) TaxID=84139 RepID=UPI003BB5A913
MSEAIRPATEADLTAIADIYAYYVEHTTATWRSEVPGLDYWREVLATTTELELPFAVLTDGEILGFAYLAPIRGTQGWRHTVEDTIYLRPDATGGGRGRRLLTALLDAADPDRVWQVIAMISSEVTASLVLHQKLGFTEAGRLPGVGSKAGLRLDCVVLQRSLKP